MLPTIGAALKPYVPQPALTWKFSTSVLPEDRAVVGAQVAQPGPAAQQPRVLELREQLERVAA